MRRLLLLALLLAACDAQEAAPVTMRLNGQPINDGPSRAFFQRSAADSVLALSLVQGAYFATFTFPAPSRPGRYCYVTSPAGCTQYGGLARFGIGPQVFETMLGDLTLTRVRPGQLEGFFALRVRTQGIAPVLVEGTFSAPLAP
jgi:hypothetical protein